MIISKYKQLIGFHFPVKGKDSIIGYPGAEILIIEQPNVINMKPSVFVANTVSNDTEFVEVTVNKEFIEINQSIFKRI
jgi:hypothetical protein